MLLRSRLASAVGRALAIVAAVALLLMMILTVVDVAGRGVFNAPFPGSYELTEIMMVVVVFAVLPLISASDKHIRVTLIDKKLSASVMLWLGCVTDAVCGLMLIVVGARVWVIAGQISSYGDVTVYYRIPVGPLAYFISIFTVVTGVVTLVQAITAPRRRPPTVEIGAQPARKG